MAYLEKQAPLKEDPRRFFAPAQSLLVAAVRYDHHPAPLTDFPKTLKIARYARGRDYHDWLPERLETLARHLSSEIAGWESVVASDSRPILERDLAQQAGLGWVGKNTCVIHPEKGSFFLLGEILTNVELSEAPTTSPIPDFCGKCQKCITACPTGALESPRLLDARKCLSYWNIESKSVPPPEIRGAMGDQFFGCDICQDVCPWNEKLFRQEPPPPDPKGDPTEELRFFLTASNREIEARWGHTPILRARPRGLRRNSLIVAANLGLTHLIPEISRWLEDEELGELARWSLARLQDFARETKN